MLDEASKAIMNHLAAGGLIAVAAYGKQMVTFEVLSSPRCIEAGLKRIDALVSSGQLRYGDPSPYKSGRVTPLLPTELKEQP